MRPDQEAIEAADTAYCKKMQLELENASDETTIKAVRLSAMRAAIDAYLSKMPRAWAIKYANGRVDPYFVYSSEKEALEDARHFDGSSAVPVAFVELKKGE